MTESLDLLDGCAVPGLDAGDWQGVLAHLSGLVVTAGHADASFPEAILERERRYPTGLPTQVPCAIPHTDPHHVRHAGVAVATLARPVAFGHMGSPGTSVQARLVVMLCLTDGQSQVAALQAILARLRDAASVEALLADESPEVFDAAVRAWLAG